MLKMIKVKAKNSELLATKQSGEMIVDLFV